MALILSRMDSITRQIAVCEDLYQASHNASEKAGLQKKMMKLTTEYMRLATQVATMI